MTIPILLITGPAGVGKTTVAFEVCAQLEAAGVAHAMIDLDETERLWPPPADDPHRERLNEANLRAIWANFAAAGASRLIVTAVMPDLTVHPELIRRALPDAELQIVRLLASHADLEVRLVTREIGSNLERQQRRSAAQLAAMQREYRGAAIMIDTAGRTVPDIAAKVIAVSGWTRGR